MGNTEEDDMLVLEEELENLREKLNKDVIKCVEHPNRQEYKKIIDLSRKLDDVIVNYIKISNTPKIRN